MDETLKMVPPVPNCVDENAVALPQHIGRYRVERVLGEGGFGLVYLAHDNQLQRPVAVKVPHRRLVSRLEDAEAYLTEAQTVAKLDHPHIVPVYDVGNNEEYPVFIVSKYIEGSTLAQRIKENRPSVAEATELVATVASTLHYAHKQGIVHRDIKPGNILLDTTSKPFVADFGRALRETDMGKGPCFAGTPAYMSPEQARREGHRVDGRSDLFSLGVVFYELLTGRRPFQADTIEELLEQIASLEARPPRQWDDAIHKELERICLKALSKRASERYTTAKDMADDLRYFLASASAEEKSTVTGRVRHETELATPMPNPVPTCSDKKAVRIVPKGLRSFDANDADFFLELLPGPRDREGLPDSIRFWKTRIEEREADNTFPVGLIYGPSGCGKSSLVKAGLLPRLAKIVTAVYVEATPDETESRLLKGLRRQVPDLPRSLGLIESMTELRRGGFLASGQKVLLVLDQFEQWLHAKRNEENTELVQALRQCDGGRVQCLVMVRDDFWMAVIRFMRDLEIRLLEGHNSAAVDLFPIRHAEKVLRAFGRDFGALPEADHARTIDPFLQALVGRLEHLSDPYRELREGVQKAIQNADMDPEMALTRIRKVLEYVIRDVYERRIKEPPGTRPLVNLVQRIVKERHFPERLDPYAYTIRKLGNFGTHPFGEKVAVADVHQSLRLLVAILDWYFEVERPEAMNGEQIVSPQPSRVPENVSAAREEHQAFLEQAVSGLAQDGKIICVRLALFAEMMKGKAWTPATLKEVGGTEGIGVTFLEETFSASTAPPEYRYHQKAARAVLKVLLPEAGTEIKGHMRSQQELLEASGYASRPRDFDDLLRILDSELRLLTPTDPEGKEDADPAFAKRFRKTVIWRRWLATCIRYFAIFRSFLAKPSDPSTMQAGAKFYQLTHDYLVPSLREWLTRKQKETRRGRAELLLADRAAVWNARPENRQLPSLLQWFQIRWLTKKKDWTPLQRKMMRRARRHHALLGLLVALLLVVATATGLSVRAQVEERRKATYAAGLVQSLLYADTARVPALLDALPEYRQWTNPLLKQENDKAGEDSRQKLHTSLALLPVDASQVKYLKDRLLNAEAGEVAVIRDVLFQHKDQLVGELWKDQLVGELWAVVESPQKGKESQRLRAAAALAKYDPESEKWTKASGPVVDQLVVENPVFLGLWMEWFRPIKGKLLASLASIYRDANRRESERSLATNILADYAAEPQVLGDLLMDADDKQFALIYPKFKKQGEQGLPVLIGEIDKKLPSDLPSSDEQREKLAKRQANAAVALLRMNQEEKVWPLLKHSPDPRVRSYLIHRLGPLGADANALVKRLDEETDLTIRRALLLSLGEFGEKEFTLEDRKAVLPKVKDIYETAADPGLHASAEWLLRTWKQQAWLKQVSEEWAKDKAQREKLLEGNGKALAKDKEKNLPQWYINTQGQTMVIIPGPVEFLMGSPAAEEGRLPPREAQHKRRIGRSFAIAAKPVTVREFRRFLRENKLEEWFEQGGQAASLMKKYSPYENGPIILVDWFRAATYCNWLSEQEGIAEEQWCYETNARKLFQEKVSVYATLLLPHHPLAAAASTSYYLRDRQPIVTALKKNYLGLCGYRLPTEAEMEYATRAGALTSRYYGETEELLPKYAWYSKNSQGKAWPVGSLKPNDFGLFDVQGNVYTWCQERYQSYPHGINGYVEDREDIYSINEQEGRVLRGVSFGAQGSNVRSSYRSLNIPAYPSNHYGFRPARTYR